MTSPLCWTASLVAIGFLIYMVKAIAKDPKNGVLVFIAGPIFTVCFLLLALDYGLQQLLTNHDIKLSIQVLLAGIIWWNIWKRCRHKKS